MPRRRQLQRIVDLIFEMHITVKGSFEKELNTPFECIPFFNLHYCVTAVVCLFLSNYKNILKLTSATENNNYNVLSLINILTAAHFKTEISQESSPAFKKSRKKKKKKKKKKKMMTKCNLFF